MAAHKGHKKAGGRRKGSPNKSTVAVKEALQQAFAGIGGVPTLIKWAQENPGEFYKLYAKLLPTEIKVDANVRSEQVTEVVVKSREEADKVLALNQAGGET